jgi:hypothetical protein
MVNITMQGRYQTRGGKGCPSKPVRLLAVHEGDPFAVVGVWTGEDRQEHLTSWTIDGFFQVCPEGILSPYDLVPVPTKHEGWMVLDIDAGPESLPVGPVYATRESAAGKRYSEHMYDNLRSRPVPRSRPIRRMILAHVTWED